MTSVASEGGGTILGVADEEDETTSAKLVTLTDPVFSELSLVELEELESLLDELGSFSDAVGLCIEVTVLFLWSSTRCGWSENDVVSLLVGHVTRG